MRIRKFYNVWLGRRWKAMVVYPFMLFKQPQSEVTEETFRHELEHVYQVREKGWLKFYLSYLWESVRRSYRDISYEEEAREAAEKHELTAEERRLFEAKPEDGKRYMLVLLIAAVLIFVAWSQADAGETTLSWTAPTGKETCTDVSEVPEISHYRIWQLVGQTEGPETSFTFTNLEPGEYTYTGQTVDVNGAMSRLAVEATKVIESMIAVAGTPVYQPLSINNAFWLLPMGTVREDTECIVGQTVNGKYAVPNTAVEWSQGSTARPVLIVADCK